jgi:hypothetical protein
MPGSRVPSRLRVGPLRTCIATMAEEDAPARILKAFALRPP